MSPDPLHLEIYDDPFTDEDKDANFKRDLAYYTRIDPMPTIRGMSRGLGIPVGVIARYILVKWATSGSEGVLELGPRVVRQMGKIVEDAERSASDSERLAAYKKLSGIVSWLNAIP